MLACEIWWAHYVSLAASWAHQSHPCQSLCGTVTEARGGQASDLWCGVPKESRVLFSELGTVRSTDSYPNLHISVC